MEHYYKSVVGFFTYPTFYSDMVKRFNKATFVEIGSFGGQSAAYMGVEIINSNKEIKLICIDAFDEDKLIKENCNIDFIKNKTFLETFKRNINPVKDIVSFKKGYSIDVVTEFEDDSVDMIFIDADHDYDPVKTDITIWYPKVKKGGIIAGHDYAWDGVKKL